jgi:site-specific DNA-methyltransferase (adenine-specific)
MTVTLYLGDCLEVLRGFEPDCIDLTVTSPPYDNLRTYKGYTFDFEGIARELYRVTKPGGVVVWVVDDRKENGSESGTSFRQALYFMELGFNLHDKMIYRKLNGAIGATNEYLQEFEMMFVFSKGALKTANLLYDRRNVVHGYKSTPKRKSSQDGSIKERHIINRAELGRRKNIWEYPVGGKQEIGYHPAPFPEALARDHILSWSNPGDLVLDPMMGSGTTGKMAVKYQRSFVGIEIAEEYYRIAERRIREAQAQPSLLSP